MKLIVSIVFCAASLSWADEDTGACYVGYEQGISREQVCYNNLSEYQCEQMMQQMMYNHGRKIYGRIYFHRVFPGVLCQQ